MMGIKAKNVGWVLSNLDLRVSQTWHYWHLGQDNSVLERAVLHVVRCLVVPLAYPLDVSSTPELQQLKMSPDVAGYPVGWGPLP